MVLKSQSHFHSLAFMFVWYHLGHIHTQIGIFLYFLAPPWTPPHLDTFLHLLYMHLNIKHVNCMSVRVVVQVGNEHVESLLGREYSDICRFRND